MAGQTVTAVQEAADSLMEIFSFFLPATLLTNTPLFYAEKDWIIDTAFFRAATMDAGTAAMTGVLVKVPSGTAATGGTVITTAITIGSNNNANINVSIPMPLVVSGSTPSENIVPGETKSVLGVVARGSTVFFRASAAPAASLTGVVLTIRCSNVRK